MFDRRARGRRSEEEASREREGAREEGWDGRAVGRRQNGKVKLRNATAASKVSPVPQSPQLTGRDDLTLFSLFG